MRKQGKRKDRKASSLVTEEKQRWKKMLHLKRCLDHINCSRKAERRLTKRTDFVIQYMSTRTDAEKDAHMQSKRT